MKNPSVRRGVDPDQVGEAPNRESDDIVAYWRHLCQVGGVFVFLGELSLIKVQRFLFWRLDQQMEEVEK
jgi:hypothetical protein